METDTKYKFEVCISFAGEDRETAEQIAEILRDSGITVFYDMYFQHDLVGRDLSAHLSEVYSQDAQFCLLLVSSAYQTRKWTMNIELPAVRERIYQDGDKYIVPVLLDDTKLPGILSTVGNIDLRKLGLDKAASLVCRKVLMERYKNHARYHPERWDQEGFLRVASGISTSQVIDIFCYYIFNGPTTEIRISTFTPLRIFQCAQFRTTLEMLCDRLETENRNGTLRIYCLPKDEEKLRIFTALSREPIDTPAKKLKIGRELAMKVLESPKVKKFLRMQILHHDGLAPFHACQLGNHMFFTTYRLGQKQDSYTIYYFDRMTAPSTFVDGFDNFFVDLDMRSITDTLNWF